MQLSSFTDYSIRVLIFLSMLQKDELTNIMTVSQRYNISKNHLVKVVHKLGQLGYIETIQGKNGGMKLKKQAKQINIGQLISQLEPLELLNCSSDSCNISPACRLKKYLIQAKNAFIKELEQYTIEDLIFNNQKLINLL